MNKKRSNPGDHDLKDMKLYMNLPAKEKLKRLEEMNAFFLKTMSLKTRKIWTKLKRQGW